MSATPPDPIKHALWLQFGAAIDTLSAAIEQCPDDLWEHGPVTRAPWYHAFHTLFWTDHYTAATPVGFAPPAPFGMEEFDEAGAYPPRAYTKDELRTYLQFCRAKVKARIENSDLLESAEPWRNWPGATLLEMCMYSMRHVQHHAAQMNLIMRQERDFAPRWVSRARA